MDHQGGVSSGFRYLQYRLLDLLPEELQRPVARGELIGFSRFDVYMSVLKLTFSNITIYRKYDVIAKVS